ncbi:MAG TPA: ABC transporter permease subunit [Vicinamibacteria bacterium]|nr:ABC transporter permease subunit [Vicinamibacteria bacterium]
MARQPQRSLPIDLGLAGTAALLLLVVVVGSAHLRPYDAPELDPSLWLVPIYILRSLARLSVAYLFAVLLALATGHLASRSAFARRIILPTLDVLQSVPILGFFPAAVTVFIGVFGGSALGVEAAAIFLIFTSMFWNLAFGVYESLITLPEDVKLAASQFGIRGPLRWTRLILPAVMPRLVYGSVLSWTNGWYFLLASEIIAVGPARYTLPGLGSYLGEAISSGRTDQLAVGLLALVLVVVSLHLVVWGPMETWADRFRLEESGDRPRTPRIARWLGRSRIVRELGRRVVFPAAQAGLLLAGRLLALPGRFAPVFAVSVGLSVFGGLGWAILEGYRLFTQRPLADEVRDIPVRLLLSCGRVGLGVALAVALAVPMAYLSFRRLRARRAVLSVFEVLGAIPATAFFPAIALVMVRLDLGMNVGSILLVLTGTFIYVMFNVLSGAAAIPKELSEAADVLGLSGPRYMARVFVPAILPSLVTGCVTAWGGGWNAVIFSEYVVAGGRLHSVRGIGATLDQATYVTGDGQVIAASLVSMVALVVLVNRLFWDPLYRHVAARYKMDA